MASLHSSRLICNIAASAAKGEYHKDQHGEIGLIFAWCAVEAALNDLLYQCGTPIAGSQLNKLARIAEATDRAGINQKLKIIAPFLDQEIALRSQPFIDLRLLIRIRNTLIHRRPELIDIKNPMSRSDLVQKVIDLDILSLENKGQPISLSALICDPAMANWAHQVAEKSISAVIAMLPDGHIKDIMGLMWTSSHP